ncbi:MAG: hypothetical protein K9N34_00465 [Candidatus Marinimicrobia bacterium]|nr:hypothetical protein [Candidatus Neomarinimicrobiota bacterium]MCF7840005.1 hypothetical protein [Candidatus Neomarinimicrobiota bacterium]
MNVYLAGAMEAAPDGGREWRESLRPYLENELHHTVHDPTHHEFSVLTAREQKEFRQWKNADFPRFQEVMHRIIKQDLKYILFHTDYMICKWDEYVMAGGGTQGELTLAFYHNIPVYLVSEIPREKISSWILGCVTEIFDSFGALKTRLRELENARKPKRSKG